MTMTAKCRTEYLVHRTCDPYSDCAIFTDLKAAQAMAENVGHCHLYEYAITPGIPGYEPDQEELVANHYMTGDEWVRDLAPPEETY
jgi:hypothetical protein